MSSNNGNGSKNRGVTRRDFFKWSAAAGAAGTVFDWSVTGPAFADSPAGEPQDQITPTKTYRSMCPYCSTGCGVIVATNAAGEAVDAYGDPSHVINRGGLCSKGAAALQLHRTDARVVEPRVKVNSVWYKSATTAEDGWLKLFGVTAWTDVVYGDTLTPADWTPVSGAGTMPVGIKTIPKSFADARLTASGPDAVAFMGSSHMTNEECYLYRKLTAVWGTNNVEHQARI